GRKDRKLTLARFAGDKKVERLGPGIASTHDDIQIERILGYPAREILPLARLPDLFAAISAAEEITFEGKPIEVSGTPVLPRATLVDAQGGGFILRIEKDPAIDEVVAMGVARCGNVLRPLGETATTGEWLERLPLARTFGSRDVAELVGKVIPEIEKK